MRDRDLRCWKALVRDRAKAEWRDLSIDVVDELACHLADLHANAREHGASEAEANRIATDVLQSASFLELSKRPRARRSPVGYVHDFKLAFRQLLATPVVSIVAVLSRALGIGANTAIFSLVDSLVLRALPVKDPGRLAIITDTADRSATTYRIWHEIEERRLFDGAFAWCETRFNLAERGETELVDGMWASSSIFDTLGVTLLLGRGFVESDDQRGGGPDGPVAVISYAFWQRRFGGAADAIGRRLALERIPFTIIGVMRPEFFGPDVGRRYDIVIPIGAEPLIRTGRRSALDEPWWWWLQMMVRLKPGQSLDFSRSTPSKRAAADRSAIRGCRWPAHWSPCRSRCRSCSSPPPVSSSAPSRSSRRRRSASIATASCSCASACSGRRSSRNSACRFSSACSRRFACCPAWTARVSR